MILITKHTDNGKSLFTTTGSFSTEDAILIRSYPESDFPIFSIASDYSNGVGKRKKSEFAVNLMFAQTDVSYFGSNILNFLRSGTRNYRYHIVFDIPNFQFYGTFKSEDIKYGFTYTDSGALKASFIVKDILDEYYEYNKILDCQFSIGGGAELSFEDFIESHLFNFITCDFGNKTYNERLNDDIVFQQIYYGNTGAPNYTDWTYQSRYEFAYSLSKGMGFDYDLICRYTAQEIYDNQLYVYPLSSLYKMKISFKTDITDDETPITISSVISHDEGTLPKTSKYIFISTRQQVPDPAGVITIIRGIVAFHNGYYESDSNDTTSGSNLAVLPYFQNYYMDNEPAGLMWRPDPDPNHLVGIPYAETQIVDIRHYSNSVIEAYGQYIREGTISPAHFFVSKNAGYHMPIARYAIQQYQRYLIGPAKKSKQIVVSLRDTPGLKLWKKITLTDLDGEGEYYVSEIQSLDLRNNSVTLNLIQL